MCGGSCEALEWGRIGLSTALTGFSVRWLDDCLDEEDASLALAVYASVALALAAAVHPRLAVTLFFCCYAVGMLGRPGERLPLGLSARQETILALMAAGWAAGPSEAVAAFAAILAVQIADDIRDVPLDARRGAGNLATRWGMVEAGIIGWLAVFVAASIEPLLPVIVFASTALVDAVHNRWSPSPREGGEPS